jgi:hypothetical protein
VISPPAGFGIFNHHEFAYHAYSRPSSLKNLPDWAGVKVSIKRLSALTLWAAVSRACAPPMAFGTCILVGNPNTGRKVTVRVNDRGPFTPGISLDLSSGAARAIGMRSTQNVTMSRC